MSNKILNEIGKYLLFAVIIFLGIASGVYVGYSFVLEKNLEPSVAPYEYVDSFIPEDIKLYVEPGDLFPLEDYINQDKTKNNFELLLKGKKTVLIFASPECEPCSKVIDQFNKIEDKLLPGSQIVLCYPSEIENVKNEKKFKVIYIDTNMFMNMYNLSVYPTIVSVDEHGLIYHIQYYYKKYIDREIIEHFTSIEV